jgi:hypothetical protein
MKADFFIISARNAPTDHLWKVNFQAKTGGRFSVKMNLPASLGEKDLRLFHKAERSADGKPVTRKADLLKILPCFLRVLAVI